MPINPTKPERGPVPPGNASPFGRGGRNGKPDGVGLSPGGAGPVGGGVRPADPGVGAGPGDLGGDEGDELTDEEREKLVGAVMAQMEQAAQARAAQSAAWRPACCNCVNQHKLALADLQQKLQVSGIGLTDPRYVPAMEQAVRNGQVFAQQPQLLVQMQAEGRPIPDYVPAIRPADVTMNGNSICLVCFPAAKQSSLLVASGSANWRG